jgi:hypothetical protein
MSRPNRGHKSLFRFNHLLPRGETHPNVMQRTTDFQNAIANACLPTAAGDVDDATTRDVAVDRLEARATAGNAPIGRLLYSCELPFSVSPHTTYPALAPL